SCIRMLGTDGIVCRWIPGDPSAISVPAVLAKQACRLIARNRLNLRPRPPQRLVSKAAKPNLRLALFITIAPALTIVSMGIVFIGYSDSVYEGKGWAAVAHSLAIFAVLCVLFFLVRPIGRLVQLADRSARSSIAKLCEWRRSKGPPS